MNRIIARRAECQHDCKSRVVAQFQIAVIIFFAAFAALLCDFCG
jgi:hypothetical protein